jgi:hypothetical protein
MSDPSVTGAGNEVVINNYYGSEDSGSTDTATDRAPDSISADALAEYLESALEDGKFSKAEQKVAEGLAEAMGGADETSEDSATDETRSEGSSELTPQDFMSQLNDIADEKKGLTDGEKKMLDEGQRMINATPEQQQAFLDKAKSLAEDSGEIGDEEAAELSGFADGLMNDASESSSGSEEAEEKPFMEQVDDILGTSQEGDEGPGEKLAREGAEMLKDNPKEDQQAYLDELVKMRDNKDSNGDYKQDIDEKNDGEGTMLKNMAESFEALPSDRSESSDDSSSSDSTSGKNNIVKFMLEEVTSDGEVTDREISELRALLEATESEAAAA